MSGLCPGCTFSASGVVLTRLVPASKIVDAIIEDLSGRKGLGDEWDQIDDDVKEQIREKWTRIMESCGE